MNAEPVTINYNGLDMGVGTVYNISFLDPGELPARVAEQLRSGRDGGFIFNVNYGMRVIRMNVEIVCDTSLELFEAIDELRTSIVRTNSTQELTINYWINGRVRKIDVIPVLFPNPVHNAGEPQTSSFTLEFKAPFPFYKEDSNTTTLNLNLAEAGGMSYPVTYPAGYIGGSSGDTGILNNTGSAPVGILEVVFNGSVINPTLKNSTTGLIIQINNTLTNAQSVTCSYVVSGVNSGRNVLRNDGVNFEEFFSGSSEFFQIPAGDNSFRFTANTFDNNASCDITLTTYEIV